MGGNKSKEAGPSPIKWTCQRKSDPFPATNSYIDDGSELEECAVMDLGREGWKWPEGRVPYKIDISLGKYPELITHIEQAIDQFHLHTPIRFELLHPDKYEDHYVIFMFHESATDSEVGMQICPQTVNLESIAKKGNVMHELMHVLGFYHEQSRPDRDEYLQVSDNIPEEAKHKYNIEGCAIGSYDPDSIMHYPADDFMRANPHLAARMGQRERFSDHDLKGLQYLYGKPQCSYDIFGEEYFIQAYYECISCWGKDSNYSICEFCKNIHHKSCETIEHIFKDMNEKGIKSVCDCGRNEHRTKICTKETICGRKIKQNMYSCIDCHISVQDFKSWWNYRKKVICKICVDNCHSGHRIISLGKFEGSCTCTQAIKGGHTCKAL